MPRFAECPVCRQPIPWTYIWRPIWSQWRCRRCGSLLGIDGKRRLLIVGLSLPLGFYSMIYLTRLGVDSLVAIPLLFAPIIVLLVLIDRPRITERAGFRCKTCGYDLHGQIAPRCPECGRELDDTERHILETGAIPEATRQPRQRIILTGLLILFFLFSLVVLGITRYVRRIPVVRPPTTTTTTTPSAP